jgi:DNA-binding NtrC family response regulator
MRAGKPTLLIVDDDEEFRSALGRLLRADYEIRHAGSLVEGLAGLSPPPDAVILDIRLTAEESNREGLVLLRHLHVELPRLPVVMVTAMGDVDLAVECIREGAVDFLQKRSDIRETRARIERALEHGRLTQRVEELERDLRRSEPWQMVGESPAAHELRRTADALGRDASVTVLIRGETGTGKELVARTIHAAGRRSAGPFVPVMINALPASMVEAELFGHEAHAFTDARHQRAGYFERAHGGVLFLDEVGELGVDLQIKLLRLLETRELHRLGGTRPLHLDVQVVAATNADLEASVRAGGFREDLYYRLRVHEIVVPPLRERRQDIPLLIAHFLDTFRLQGKRVWRIAPQAEARLQSLPWPGNVRQLKNAIESALVHAELHGHGRIELEDLAATVAPPPAGLAERARGPGGPPADIQEALARAELAYIDQALAATGGRKAEAWKLLGYRDRFAPYRRIRRILERFPELAKEFTWAGAAAADNP